MSWREKRLEILKESLETTGKANGIRSRYQIYSDKWNVFIAGVQKSTSQNSMLYLDSFLKPNAQSEAKMFRSSEACIEYVLDFEQEEIRKAMKEFTPWNPKEKSVSDVG